MEYIENELTYETYVSLRTSIGGVNFSEVQTKMALERSFYTLTAVMDNQAVGMARLVGDGLYLILVDVFVNPDYQGMGIGKTITQKMIQHVKDITPVGGRVSLQLIAEKGKEGFYQKLGFKRIPHEHIGSGMRMVIRVKE